MHSEVSMVDDKTTKQLLEIINNRRSIREFLDKPVNDEVLTQILETGFRAPFAAQLCSVIYTRDREKMLEAGIWTYPTAPVHLIYFIDLVRLEKIMTKRGHKYGHDKIKRYKKLICRLKEIREIAFKENASQTVKALDELIAKKQKRLDRKKNKLSKRKNSASP